MQKLPKQVAVIKGIDVGDVGVLVRAGCPKIHAGEKLKGTAEGVLVFCVAEEGEDDGVGEGVLRIAYV